MQPSVPATAQLLQSASLFERQRRFQEAERLYHAILAREPHHFDGLHRLGLLRSQQGKLDDAARLVRKAVARNPRSPDAHSNLGNILQALNRHKAAVEHYEKALALRPDFAEAHNNLAAALQALNRLEEAVAHYQTALRIKPQYAEAHNNFGAVLQRLNRAAEGIAHFRQAIALKPDYVDAFNNLGTALAALDRPGEAVGYFATALRLDANSAAAHNSLGNALCALARPRDAVPHFERALALRPDFAEAHNNLGTALDALEQSEAAIVHYKKAIALTPDYADPHNNLGAVFTRMGSLAEARSAFERAVGLAPRRAAFLANLAEAKRFVAGDRDLAAMEGLARDEGTLSIEEQTRLHFALGKAYADLEQHEQAFRHLAQGNALKRQQSPYDEPSTLHLFDRVRAAFDHDLLKRCLGQGDDSPVPIFVLGMPRSGTTLVEQILASHPKVFGAGELEEFDNVVARLGRVTGSSQQFPEMMKAITAEQLRWLGASYVAATKARAPAAERITDKMPGNFLYAGLIHLALPKACIIHTRRDPADTCFSCFSKLFKGEQPHTYHLGELGRYYRAYEGLMAHWRRTLPAGIMLEVHYERLVADFELEARRMLAHCGLEWDPACLEFHKTRRPVLTASATQVRQPIYDRSIGRWRPYKEMLRPLLDELGAETP